jgi:hypothetical protein
MPTVLRIGPYRFYFFSHENNEPAHIHIDRDKNTVKFWLSPVHLARNIGFRPVELHKIENLVLENHSKLMEAWDGYLGTDC